jgi:DNA-3-methyladenine glycosylase II
MHADSLRDDPNVGPLVERHGPLELGSDEQPFERLVISIVNQLLSTEAARTIRERLFDAVEITPNGVRETDTETMREAGLSAQKVEYVRAAADAYDAGRITPEALAELDDDTAIAELTEVKGIGDWTAKMYLMFVLERPDVFPVEDLAVRRGMEELFGDESRDEMRERAANWEPYRSYATLYVWHHYVDENSDVAEPVA